MDKTKIIDLENSSIHKWKIKENLLQEALTHPNYFSIDPVQPNFERLEFLGDAVLDVLSAEWLYKNMNEDVGVLSKLRSLLVQTNTLAEVGKEINIHKHLLVEPHYKIEKTDLEDCLEAIFGAFYLSNGLSETKELFNLLFLKRLEKFKEELSIIEKRAEILDQIICEKNPINSLQEFCQKHHISLPEYNLVEKKGTDHEPVFIVECLVDYLKKTYRKIGEGRNMKTARSKAAEAILANFKQLGFIKE
ncbi:MAG: ribonuclease III family protein [Candidatus Heimdallarchaeaceae archaeon]